MITQTLDRHLHPLAIFLALLLFAWYRNYLDGGPKTLEDRMPEPRKFWNKVLAEIGETVMELALKATRLTLQPRWTRYFIRNMAPSHGRRKQCEGFLETLRQPYKGEALQTSLRQLQMMLRKVRYSQRTADVTNLYVVETKIHQPFEIILHRMDSIVLLS